MTTSKHVIRCRETGQPLANKLDGGTCVCKPGECEMRKLRDREGDYARKKDEDEGFDGFGFAIGLATGFPVSPRGITAGSIIGALLHPTERYAPYDVTSATFDGGGGTVGGAGASASWTPDTKPAPEPQAASASEPAYVAPEPAREPDPAPSYSTPDPAPSYTPDPSPSFGGGGDSGGGGSVGGGGE